MSTGVWLGHPDSSASLNGSVIAGGRCGRMYGATLAAPIWYQYMTRVHEGLPGQDFPGPSPKVQYGDRTAVPKVAGMTVDQARAGLSQAGFRPATAGSTGSNADQEHVVGTRPGPGTVASAGSTVTVIAGSGRPKPPPSSPTGTGQ